MAWVGQLLGKVTVVREQQYAGGITVEAAGRDIRVRGCRPDEVEDGFPAAALWGRRW